MPPTEAEARAWALRVPSFSFQRLSQAMIRFWNNSKANLSESLNWSNGNGISIMSHVCSCRPCPSNPLPFNSSPTTKRPPHQIHLIPSQVFLTEWRKITIFKFYNTNFIWLIRKFWYPGQYSGFAMFMRTNCKHF